MARIALDFDRPTLSRLNEDPYAVSLHGSRSGIVKRLAGDDLFGLFDVGNDSFFVEKNAATTGDAGKRHRGAHELKEGPAIDLQKSGAIRKLILHPGAELRGLGNLLEAPPIRAPLLAGELCSHGVEVQTGRGVGVLGCWGIGGSISNAFTLIRLSLLIRILLQYPNTPTP